MYLKLLNLLRRLKFLFSKSEYKFIKSSDIMISTQDIHKNYFYNNKLYCTLVDPLAEYLKKKNYKVVAISAPGGKIYKDDTWLKYLNINRNFYISRLKDLILGNGTEVNFWLKLFKKVNPKIIICIQPSSTMCVAAKLSNIIIADMQHGFISNSIYYNLNNPYGEKGLPNMVLCWDDISSDYVKKILPNISSYVIGNPWIMKFKEKNLNKFIGAENKKLELVISKRPVIIITLQWKKNVTKKIIDMPKNVVKSLQILVNKEWDCWIRFHPAHKEEFSRETLHQNWNKTTNLKINSHHIHDVSDFSLPYLLKFTNVHITNFSASIIDSKIMNVPTYFWCKDKKIINSLIQNYLKNKYINRLPGNINKIAIVLDKHKIKKKKSLNSINISKTEYDNFIKIISKLKKL